VSEERWTQVDQYFTDLFGASDAALEAALQACTAAGLPPIGVSPNQGKLLMLLARLQGASAILEVGTLGGYSTIWLARGVPAHGRVVTLEVDPVYADVARSNVNNAGVGDRVEIIVGDARKTIADLNGQFDLIFIDADKESYPDYFVGALELSRVGTLIVADNVVREGAVIDADSDDERVQGIRRFNELVAAEPRVDATAIQMVGPKGYDGFAVVLVTADA
jgi:predicted O-methyltransferase YrrM